MCYRMGERREKHCRKEGLILGAPKKYTEKTLKKAVNLYFDSISREVEVTEMVATDKKDKMGHTVYEKRPVTNKLGNVVKDIQYLIPPSVAGLCEFLKIHISTWDNYCDNEKHPEFFETTTRARGRIHAYLVQESLTRQGKDLKGVLFNLENNFGYKERHEIVNDTVESFLQNQLEQGGGQLF